VFADLLSPRSRPPVIVDRPHGGRPGLSPPSGLCYGDAAGRADFRSPCRPAHASSAPSTRPSTGGIRHRLIRRRGGILAQQADSLMRRHMARSGWGAHRSSLTFFERRCCLRDARAGAALGRLSERAGSRGLLARPENDLPAMGLPQSARAAPPSAGRFSWWEVEDALMAHLENVRSTPIGERKKGT
jgi:hypothetical protein